MNSSHFCFKSSYSERNLKDHWNKTSLRKDQAKGRIDWPGCGNTSSLLCQVVLVLLGLKMFLIVRTGRETRLADVAGPVCFFVG